MILLSKWKERIKMKYVKQFFLILVITFMGEVLHEVLPFPVPASIYGLVLMFAGLSFGVISPGKVKETGGYLIEIMPMMFIPAAAGLLVAWPLLRPVFVPVALITLLTTVFVMVVTGRVAQFILDRDDKKEDDKNA